MSAYDSVAMHRLMVGDEVRTSAFRHSILATVRPGDVVVDVGAGSAILCLFAVMAGAVRVYGIERAAGAAALGRRVINDNGVADRVQIIEGSAETVRVPEPADVVVSEWLGVFGIDENMLAPVLVARDRWLKPGGFMIPGEVTAWIAPAWHPAGADAFRFRTNEYGVNLIALAPFHPDQIVWLPTGSQTSDLRANPQPLWIINPLLTPAADAVRPFAAQLTFEVSGPFNCLVTWFSAELPGEVSLTNGPGAPPTHWGQFLYPVANGADATPTDRLDVGFHCVPKPGGGSDQLWASQVNSGALEVHDSRRVPRPPGMPPWRRYDDSARTT
jgi:SAM-dependent methyltransferase